MAEFRHYILTRFNVGLYGADSQAKIEPDKWFEHRLRLFKAFTLPSILNQSCRDFTWIILIDKATPKEHEQILRQFENQNIKIEFKSSSPNPWLDCIAENDGDLITTRIDNDDAFSLDVVETIQRVWRQGHQMKNKPWVIVFPYGAILDVNNRKMFGMEYWFNNCPTLIESRTDVGTIWQWDHSRIPAEFERHYVVDKPYWLQVIHSQNIKNAIPDIYSAKKLLKEVELTGLRHFGIDWESVTGQKF
jgi:hypothetical protein